MSSVTVAARGRGDVPARAVSALASHPRVDRVALVGRQPPASWGDRVEHVRSPEGFDVVIEPEPSDPGIVVTAGGSDRPGITHASLTGLARALKVRLADPGATAVHTVHGRPLRRGRPFPFPLPLGILRAPEPSNGTTAAPTDSAWAGAGAFGGAALVVMDDRRFLEAVCLAAGALVAAPAPTVPTPVWGRAERYLEACVELGAVIAASGDQR